MIPKVLCGYTSRLSYAPGEEVVLHCSAPVATVADIRLVRLQRAFDSESSLVDNVVIPWDGAGRYPIAPQRGAHGSFGTATVAAGDCDAVTLGAFVWVNSEP